jgi:tRNA (guanine-N7-)-methyltransferase
VWVDCYLHPSLLPVAFNRCCSSKSIILPDHLLSLLNSYDSPNSAGVIPSNEKPYSQKWYRERQSHLSSRQRAIIRDLWPSYGITLNYNYYLDPRNGRTYNSSQEHWEGVYLDIGFGSGESFIYHAERHPQHSCIGIEVHKAGIAKCLQSIEAKKLMNSKLIRADMSLLINQNLADASLDIVSVYFPDPWPNAARDSQRRVIRLTIVSLLSRKMARGGCLRMATDVEDYAEHIESTMSTSNQILSTTESDRKLSWKQTYRNCHDAGKALPPWRPITAYEIKAAEEGRRVHDFEYQLQSTE